MTQKVVDLDNYYNVILRIYQTWIEFVPLGCTCMGNHIFPLCFTARKFFLQFSHMISWKLIDEKYLFIAGKLIFAGSNDPIGWISCASFGCREVPQNGASLRGKRAIHSRAILSRTGSEQNPRLNLTSIILIFEMSPFGSLSPSLFRSNFTFRLIKKT
jgi:hypothetical protein